MTSRNSSGRWKAGQSGNPAGRKPGTGALQQLRRDIEASVPQIIAALTEKARAGDVGAARLLLERTVPTLRPVEALQALQINGGDLSDQARAIVGLVASGELPVSQAAQLVAALGTVGRLIEVDEIERRIQSLENSLETRHVPAT